MVQLEKEFNYYIQNQDRLVEMYRGKYVVIKENDILGVFDTEINAINEISKTHKLGTFLVQKCEPGSANYSQTFHSRVIFA